MTDPVRPLAYDDFSSPEQMRDDCRALGRNVPALERAARAAVGPAPSIHYDDFPAEVRKRDIAVTDAAQRLANALHLHLD